MKCIHCGTENPDTSKFCNNCGAKLEPEQDKSLISKESPLKLFFDKYKSWIIGYAAWVVVNITLLLFGGKYHEEGYNSFIHPKNLFFPFKGKAENYDFTEFFVYVVALPVLAYAIYYFYNKYKAYKLSKTNNSVDK